MLLRAALRRRFSEGLCKGFRRVLRRCLVLWSGRGPNSTETPKKLSDPKWFKRGSRGPTPEWRQVTQKRHKKDSKSEVRSHFWVDFRSLWGRSARVTFESLLGRFKSFSVFVYLGARPLHKSCSGFHISEGFLEEGRRGFSEGGVGKVLPRPFWEYEPLRRAPCESPFKKYQAGKNCRIHENFGEGRIS